MLLVLVEQVVEDFLVQESDAFEVVAGPGLEGDDLVDQAVGLVRQVGDVLLASHFLLHVGRVVADLQHDRVQSRLLFLLKALDS